MSDQQNDIYRDPAEIRHQIGANGQFTLSVAAGSVEIRAGDSGEAVVLARSEGGRADALPLSVRKSDGTLQIEVTDRSAFAPFSGWFGRHSGVDFQVTLPAGARATISTVSADIRSEGLVGEQTYKTVSGDAELAPAGGRLRVSTVSGDMQVRNSGSIELSLSTTSGDMRVRGAELKAFDARSVSGDIDLAGSLAAGPLHSAETVSGDLAIDAHGGVTVDIRRGLDFGGGPRTLVSGDGAAQLRFRTLSGDVRVEGGRRADEPRDQDHGRHERAQERMERHAARRAERFAARMARFDDDSPTEPVENLGVPPAPPAPEPDQLEVLRALERGEIDVDEAARRLQEA
jgi:Toastrack DUF4097